MRLRAPIGLHTYYIMLLGSERVDGDDDDVQVDLWKYLCYNTTKKQLRLRAPPVYAFSKQQPDDFPAKKRPPMNDSAAGASRGRVCSLPGVADNRKYMEIPVSLQLGLNQRVGSVVEWVRGWSSVCVALGVWRVSYFLFSGPMVASPLLILLLYTSSAVLL